MVIDDFDIRRVPFQPAKAHPELVVDPDAMLALTIGSKSFEPVTRRRSQVLKRSRGIKISQLAPGDREQI